MSARSWFVWAGRAEAVSFLLLLGVAVPLKYVAGHREATLVPGWIHGLLFVAYLVALARIAGEQRWPRSRTALAVAAALVPFGPFLFERRLER